MSSIETFASDGIDEEKVKQILQDEHSVRPIIAQLAREANRDGRLTLVTPKEVFNRLSEHLKISPLHITTNPEVKSFIKQLSRKVVTEVAEGLSAERYEHTSSETRKRKRPDGETVNDKKAGRLKKRNPESSETPPAEGTTSGVNCERKRRKEKPDSGSPKRRKAKVDNQNEPLNKLTRLCRALGRGPAFYKGLPPKTEVAQRAAGLRERLIKFVREHKIGKGGGLPTLQEAKKWREDENTRDELRSLGLHASRDGELKERQRRIPLPQIAVEKTSSSDASSESGESEDEVSSAGSDSDVISSKCESE